MQVYTFPRSRSLKVLWTLEELGVAYESIKVDLLNKNSGTQSPHSRKKVPFLVDEDVSIEETMAICIYLCEKYPSTAFYPTQPKKKALINSWISFALTDLEAPIWNLLKQQFFIPENQRDPKFITYFKDEADKVVSQIKLGDDDWITGSDFTLADIFMSQILVWAKLGGVSMDENITHYMEKTINRPAYLKAQQRNDQ